MFTTSTSPFYLSNMSQRIITGKGIKKGLNFISDQVVLRWRGGGGMTSVHRLNPQLVRYKGIVIYVEMSFPKMNSQGIDM